MAVKLEVPVRVRGEPVVVAAVQDDGVVVADAAVGQQRLELGLADEVATYLVLEVHRPVELDGALDVALVVGGGVLIDLDKDDTLLAGMLGDPITVDEYFLPGFAQSLLLMCCIDVEGEGTDDRTRGRDEARPVASPNKSDSNDDKEVRLSTFAEADTKTSASGNDLQHAGGERQRPRVRHRGHEQKSRGGALSSSNNVFHIARLRSR